MLLYVVFSECCVFIDKVLYSKPSLMTRSTFLSLCMDFYFFVAFSFKLILSYCTHTGVCSNVEAEEIVVSVHPTLSFI